MTAPVSVGVSASVSASVSAGVRTPSNAPAPFAYPYQTFRFHVHFTVDPLDGGEGEGTAQAICNGAFSECTGLEATMEAKVIKEGGRNYGAAQRAGSVTFATVVLKRGLTTTRDMWTWFDLVTNQHAFARRLAATINVYDHSGRAVLAWRLSHAIPVKFKGADLNARGTEVGVEELHLVHEGLTMVAPSHPTIDAIPQPR
jgi:phage tail-like protein